MGRGGRHSTETDRLLGRRLKQERLLSGRSRASPARRIGTSPETLREYEEGARRLHPAHMVTATAALGVPLSVLFADHAEASAEMANSDDEKPLRIAITRPLELLSRPGFARFRPLLDLWVESRGRLSDDVYGFITRTGLLRHMSWRGRNRGRRA